jgi:hypothetical protein
MVPSRKNWLSKAVGKGKPTAPIEPPPDCEEAIPLAEELCRKADLIPPTVATPISPGNPKINPQQRATQEEWEGFKEKARKILADRKAVTR